MTPLGRFIPWRWESAFLGIARSPAAQSSMPGEAGIPWAVKTRGLEKGNAEEAEFFFIWGGIHLGGMWVFACLVARFILPKTGLLLGRDRPFKKNDETCQVFS